MTQAPLLAASPPELAGLDALLPRQND